MKPNQKVDAALEAARRLAEKLKTEGISITNQTPETTHHGMQPINVPPKKQQTSSNLSSGENKA